MVLLSDLEAGQFLAPATATKADQMTSTHQPRRLRSIGMHSCAAWRMKTYAITLQNAPIRQTLISATLAKMQEVLPPAAFDQGRHGVGFTISHDAAGVCFGLIYWWEGENELHQRLFMAPKEAPADLRAIENPTAGCVWELGIIDFERRAWLADVLANPAGADLELYMSRRLDAEV